MVEIVLGWLDWCADAADESNLENLLFFTLFATYPVISLNTKTNECKNINVRRYRTNKQHMHPNQEKTSFRVIRNTLDFNA